MSFIGKKEDVFFKLFADSIAKVAEASAVFMDLVTNFENAEQKVAHLKVLETECDDQTFNIIKQLNRSFVTPLDREDIFHIAKEIDDIVDYLEDAANFFLIFEVGSIRPEVITMTEIILKSITELESLFQHLSDMKKTRPIMDNVVDADICLDWPWLYKQTAHYGHGAAHTTNSLISFSLPNTFSLTTPIIKKTIPPPKKSWTASPRLP